MGTAPVPFKKRCFCGNCPKCREQRMTEEFLQKMKRNGGGNGNGTSHVARAGGAPIHQSVEELDAQFPWLAKVEWFGGKGKRE